MEKLRRAPISPEGRELQALRQGLSIQPAGIPLADLRPVFVPASFFETGTWPGPYLQYELPGLALTWVVLQPEQTMRYVDASMVAYWESEGIAWRERALTNLLQSASDGLFTHEFRRDDGTLYAVGLMQDDGIGPSRLLAEAELEALFPGGYLVALPEMSCALALSAAVSERERRVIEELERRCFNSGTRPLVPGIHSTSLLRPCRAV